MNSKGLFSIALIISVAAIYGLIVGQIASTDNMLKDSVLLAIKSEKAGFLRDEIEINAENIIKNSIKQNMLLGNEDPSALKRDVVLSLLDYFGKSGKKPEISCFISDKTNGKEIKISEKNLSNLFAVNVISISKVKIIEITMHAGLLKNLEPTCKINFENVSAEFKMPADYTLKLDEYEWAD